MPSQLPRRSRLVNVLISCSLIGSLTACGTESSAATESTTRSAPAATGNSTVPEHSVTLYHMNDQATAMVRTVIGASDNPARVTAALKALSEGAPPSGTVQAFPTGTEIIAVTIVGEEARVDLTRQFVKAYPRGGASAEIAVLAPIVYTATEIPGVARVVLTVDGQVPAPVGSQFDWAGPFTRADFPALEVVDR